MCPCRSTIIKYTILVQDVDSGWGSVCLEQELYANSVLCAHFCCRLKTALKNSLFKAISEANINYSLLGKLSYYM